MNDLIERIEAASGPDRELDALIAVALDCRPDWATRSDRLFPVSYGRVSLGKGGPQWEVKSYTASIDAALTLVPEGRSWELTQVVSEGISIAFIWNMFEAGEGDSAEAATPALALSAAAMKSRAYLKETNNAD